MCKLMAIMTVMMSRLTQHNPTWSDPNSQTQCATPNRAQLSKLLNTSTTLSKTGHGKVLQVGSGHHQLPRGIAFGIKHLFLVPLRCSDSTLGSIGRWLLRAEESKGGSQITGYRRYIRYRLDIDIYIYIYCERTVGNRSAVFIAH